MRLFNPDFAGANAQATKTPLVTVEIAFDSAGTDLIYCTSSSSAEHPSGATVFDGTVQSVAQITQRLNPDQALSTIGSMAIDLVDAAGGLSTILNTKLTAGSGTRGKAVRIYIGYPGLTFDQYETVSTQVWDMDDSMDGRISIKCADIQREARIKIFEPAKSKLQAAVDASAATIQILTADISSFVAVEHDFSYTDAPAIQTAASISASGATATITRTSGNWEGTFDYLGANQTARFASWATADNNVECTITAVSGNTLTVSRASGTWTTESSTTIELFPSVGYIKMKTGDAKEYIRWSGKSGDTFTGCVRGVLLSKPAAHGSATGSSTDVEEVIYLEGPAVKLAQAVLTGELHGQQGATLPSNWNTGIASRFFSLTEFTNIGNDIWSVGEGDAAPLGPQRISKFLRFVDEDDTDGKKWVEEQIMLPIGCFMRVLATGELGLRRMTGVLSGSAYTRHLTTRNVTSYGTLQSDKRSVINNMAIRWSRDPIAERYQRTTRLIDSDSIAKHGRAPAKVLEFRGITDTIQTESVLYGMFDSLRNRYAGPPWRISVGVLPSLNGTEVGDLVRLDLPHVRDYAGEVSSIDRVFEVQQIRADWINGDVSLELFGSTETASIIEKPSSVLDSANSPISDSWYTSAGTELKTALGAGEYTEAGGTLTITGGGDNIATLTGGSTTTASGSIFYYDGNVTVANTCTLRIESNVQLRVKGTFTNDGTIDASGRGGSFDIYYTAGTIAVTSTTVITGTGTLWAANVAAQDALSFQGQWIEIESVDSNTQITLASPLPAWTVGVVTGYAYRIRLSSVGLGQTWAAGGITIDGTKSATLPVIYASAGRPPPEPLEAAHLSLDGFAISWDGSDLQGLPADLRGVPGGAGAYTTGVTGSGSTNYAGGAGGAGGAGLLVVCRGVSVSGSNGIDFSGADGSLGASVPVINSTQAYSGSGAGGAAGGFMCVVDGSSKTHPGLPGLRAAVTANQGDCPLPQPLTDLTLIAVKPNVGANAYVYNPAPAYAYHNEIGKQASDSVPAVVWLQVLQDVPAQGSEESNRVYADDVTTLTLTESTNTPKSAAGNLSTIEADITAPSDTNWKEAVIEYRVNGSSAPFLEIGRTTTSLTVVVASDGTAYEFRARSVSRKDVPAPDGVSATITVTDIDSASSGTPVPETVLPVPNVYGLEIFEQGNDDEFTGKDCKASWRKTSTTEWVELGAEVAGQGAGQGTLDLYFQDYRVQIYDDSGNLLREEFTTDNWYWYTFEKNAEDYKRINGVAGAYRVFWFRIRIRSRQNQFSPRDAVLRVSNPLPSLLNAVSLDPTFNGVVFASQPSTDLDLAGVRIWVSTSSGFTPGDSTLVYYGGHADRIGITNLTPDTTYYLVYSPFDTFGIDDSNLSSELSFTTDSALLTAAVEGVFAGPTSIAGVFAATGSQAWANYNPGDTVTISDATFRIEVGPVVDGSDTYIIRWHQPSTGTTTFWVKSDGSVLFGDLSAGKSLEFDATAGTMTVGRAVRMVGAGAYGNTTSKYWEETFRSLDGWNIGTTGTTMGALSDGLAMTFHASSSWIGYISRSLPSTRNFSWSNKRRIRFSFLATSASSRISTLYVISGQRAAGNGFGAYFTWSGSALTVQAWCRNAAGPSFGGTQTITTSGTTVYEIEVVFTPSSDVELFLDGSSVSTVSTTLPSGATSLSVWSHIEASSTATGSSDVFKITTLEVQQDS